jgi:DNA-directed RNA polymerase specialized sigma24 family protein
VNDPRDVYVRWLYKTAGEILPGGSYNPGLEDLVQEGRIAIWRARDTHDPEKGPLMPWLQLCARHRMHKLVWGDEQPVGHQPVRGVRPVDVVASLDELQIDENPWIPGEVLPDLPEPTLMAALRELSPQQREYIYLRFWQGIEPSSRNPGTVQAMREHPILRNRWLWARTREKLRNDPRIRALAQSR